MSENEQKPKKKTGHPPWTEEQKQARRELNARKRVERAEEQRRQESAYEAKKRRKSGAKLRDGQTGTWSPEMRAHNKATWDRKRKERDEKNFQILADNPTKTKKELGLSTWHPAEENDEGYIRRYMKEARISIDLPPINVADPEQVQNRINEYLDFCEMNNKIPQIVGLANWLGVDQRTLQRWKTGVFREETHTPIIKRVLMMLEEIWVDMMQTNKINPANGIFLAKNLFQYKDQQDVVVSANDNGIKEMSDEDIKNWYLEDGKKVETEFTDKDGGEQ